MPVEAARQVIFAQRRSAIRSVLEGWPWQDLSVVIKVPVTRVDVVLGTRRADGGYSGQLVDWATTALNLTVEIIRKLAGQIGFQVLPRRWVAERTFAWINRCRRTVRDYERLPEHHAAMVHSSMVIIMTRRLARHRRTTHQQPPTRAA